MKVPKEHLLELLEEPDKEVNGLKFIESKQDGSSRWSANWHMIFKFEEKFYLTHYSVGLTESQDERPYEYDPDDVEVFEVEPHTVTKIVYRIKKGA